MQLYTEKVVYLSHYSKRRPILTHLLEFKDNSICLKLRDSSCNLKVSKGDCIVLNFNENNNVYLCEGYVLNNIREDNFISIRIDQRQMVEDNRIFERFPVSLYANIKHNGTSGKKETKKSAAVIKNISLSGMGVTSREELKDGQKFDCDVFIDERIVKIQGEVAWRKKEGANFEYGIKTQYPDFVYKNTVKLYLNILKNEQISLYN